MENPFVLSPGDYHRRLDIMKDYMEDSSLFLSISFDKPIDECREIVKTAIQPGGPFEFNDPKIMYLEREENGDRVQKLGTLSKYIRRHVKEGNLIAPTFTTYIPHARQQSLLVDYIDQNVKARSVAKKAKFKAEENGDMVLYAIKDNEQNNKKINNNSISGAHLSPFTPLYNRTAHSTLTSNCRNTSGYGNANNEKLLSGNRHYYSPDIVINNIVSIIRHTDYERLEKTINDFRMAIPTVGDVMSCIRFSAMQYWRAEQEYARLEQFVQKLQPLQRAAFVYTGDLYHIMKHNDALVRNFIGSLSRKVIKLADGATIDYGLGGKSPKEIIKSVQEEYVHLAVQICRDSMIGKKMEDVEKFEPDTYETIAATAKNIYDTVIAHRDFIKTFFVTENVPASVGFFPESVRHAALTSDTDSTIFTVQDWVIWSQGRLSFDEKSVGVAATMIFLSAATITHILAMMSANFGIPTERIHQVAMKNEFFFDIFTPSQVAKHYYATISCQEGNIKAKRKSEIKGVHLRSSSVPKEIMAKATAMMERIMDTLIIGKKIRINEILKEIADVERELLRSVRAGESTFFRRQQLQPAAAYSKGPTESNYLHHLIWNETFGPKYGMVDEPPYAALKMSSNIDSPTKTREWLENMKDRELANRISETMAKYGKAYFGAFVVPREIIETQGAPEELLDAVGIRKLISDTCYVFYVILETLGVYMMNDKITRLVSDYY